MTSTSDKLLAAITTEAEFEALRRQPEPWLRAMEAICADHALAGELRLFQDGSCVLFSVGERWVIKLFEPWFPGHYEAECAVMAHVQGRLPVPTPELVHHGQLEGWGYVVMTRLGGRNVDELWTGLKPDEHASVSAQVGTLAAALHGLPTTGLEDLRPQWRPFIAAQREGCVARHRGLGLAEGLLAEIEVLLETVAPDEPDLVLLHTELTGTNLLASAAVLSGMIDFEPSMLGVPEYDLVGAAIFIGRGRRESVRAGLQAYGYASADLDEALQRRLMAYTLLHRYSNLGFFWRQVSDEPLPASLQAITDGFFPLLGRGVAPDRRL